MGTPAPNDIIWGRTEITIETPVYKYDRKDFSGYAYKHTTREKVYIRFHALLILIHLPGFGDKVAA